MAAVPRAEHATSTRSQALRLGVSLALLGLLLFLADLETVSGVIAGARPELLALMFACMVGERLFAAFRWLVLLRTVEPGVAYWPVLRVTLVSNFVGTFLPGGVGIEVLRVYGLSRAMADLPLALSSVLVERLCGLMALVLLTAIGLLLAPIHLPDAVQVVLGAGLVALLAAGAVLLHPWPRRIGRRLLALPRLAPLMQRLVGFERRIDAYARRPFALALSLALALAFQLLRVTTVVVGAHALGVEAALTIFIAIVPITILVALLPISLGGLGAREVSYVALFGLAGVQPEAALVLALAREAMQLVTTLPGAVLYARSPAPQKAQAIS
jgi:glycosyltransferase 2 family protein